MLRRIVCSAVGLCLSAAGALAQSGWTPQDGIDMLPRGADQSEHVSMLGWQFHPITDGTQVVAFFATITGDNAWGGNVKLMYFTHNASGVWTSYGWAEDGTDGAVAWIKSQHGASALARSDIFAGYNVPAAAVAPEEMKDGFFVTDPNAALIDGLDKDQAQVVLDWLADAGYKVAPNVSSALGVAGQAVLNESMSYMSNQVEYTLYPLKTSYMVAPQRRWCNCYTTSSTVTGIGPARLVPSNPPISPNPVMALGACDYTFERVVSTTTTRSVGDTKLCVDCTGTTVTEVKQHVTIRVLAPCTAPTPTNADPWS